MTDRVDIGIDGHVATVMLNRADKYNALDFEMFAALGEAADTIAGSESIRAVVLHGAGENFCAGIDVSVFAESGMAIDAAAMAPLPGGIANRFQQASYAWRELEMPVICAIHGVAFGAGLQIALGADLRYASPDAQLSIMEVKWGLIPDLAISTTARGLVSADRLKELAFSGRVIGADEALQFGRNEGLLDAFNRWVDEEVAGA